MKTRLGIAALAAGVIAIGCNGGGGGGDDSLTVQPEDAGGFIILGASSNFGFAFAQFWSAVEGSNLEPFTIEFGTDECEPVVTDTSGDGAITTLDVGIEIAFDAGTASFVAARQTDPGTGAIGYFGFSNAEFPTSTDYVVENAGSTEVPAGTLATIYVTEPVVATIPTIVPGQDLEITWTGGDDASFINIDIGDGGGADVYLCNAKNDGSFTIPAAATSAAGANGDITVTGPRYDTATVNGRTVVVVGAGL